MQRGGCSNTPAGELGPWCRRRRGGGCRLGSGQKDLGLELVETHLSLRVEGLQGEDGSCEAVLNVRLQIGLDHSHLLEGGLRLRREFPERTFDLQASLAELFAHVAPETVHLGDNGRGLSLGVEPGLQVAQLLAQCVEVGTGQA